MWIEPISHLGEHENRLVLAAPKPILTWVERRYAEVIGDTIREHTDFDGAILCLPPAGPAPKPGWV